MTSLLKGFLSLLVPQLAVDDDVFAAQVADLWVNLYGEAA